MPVQVMADGVVRDATPNEAADIRQRQSAAQNVVIPRAVSMLQARLALIDAGLFGQVDSHIQQMTGQPGEAARAYWQFATRVLRDDPLVNEMSRVLKLDSAALDQLFLNASQQ